MLKNEDMDLELKNLKERYRLELEGLSDRAMAAQSRLSSPTNAGSPVSSHDAFNMAATCGNLLVLAGKIEQTENCIRWMSGR
jgi:hypothetical protein